MNLQLKNNGLKGVVKVPGSKSMAHRALFCAAFADAETLVKGAGISEDIRATLRALEVLGAAYTQDGEDVLVRPVSMCGPKEQMEFRLRMRQEGMPPNVRAFDCGESGTTFRFVVPLLGIDGEITEIKMRGRLAERPVKDLLRELSKKGMAFDQMGYAFRAQGELRSGTYRLPGNVSSQYISALLTALPLVSGESRIEVEGAESSAPYIDMTLDMVRRFGGKVVKEDQSYLIESVSCYHSPGTVSVEGDWSAAAFWMTAGALGADVTVQGVSEDSVQGDRVVKDLLPEITAGGAVIDVDACPDLLPVLAAAAAVSPGTTAFTGAARLRIKESDRLESTAGMIRSLGGSAQVADDCLTVEGTGSEEGIGTLPGGTVDACGDHRIAMSAAVASTVCTGPVTVCGAEAVAKSYPDFWNDYRALGGVAEEV